MPLATRQGGDALQEFCCPLPPGSVAVPCRSCTTRCGAGSEAVHSRSFVFVH